MKFGWHETKAKANLRKHGVSFEEATTVFADPLASTVADPTHSEGEHRFLTFGLSSSGRGLVVSYTERDSVLRIISARAMTKHERQAYEDV